MDALAYARLAQAAYTSTPTIGQEGSAARAILSFTNDGRVISLPGTNNTQCVIADIDCEVVQVNGLGGLHNGFYDAALSIWPSIQTALPAVLCGHSEGASLSLILAGMLCVANLAPKYVYAFEPARVSIDPTLGQLLTAHSVQLLLTRKGNDIVPMLPPDLLHSWQHPAPLKSIGEAIEPFDNVDDHVMQGVIAALANVPPIESHFIDLHGLRG